MKIDITTFNQLVDQKYLSVQKHSECDLLVWNYTQRCQFDGHWIEETMMARGLITTGDGTIAARPFKKFFNLEEHTNEHLPALPVEQFFIQEKYDGSLGILYWIGDEPHLATRGSFNSEQAIKGTEMLRSLKPQGLNRSYTYLCEIIYPDNRIVVDYGGREMLILLAVIDTETGKDLDIYEECGDFPFAGYIDGITDFKELKAKNEQNKEGFVVRFQSGLRVKLKFEEYVRLHRLVTGVNAKTIWELLKNKQSFDELLDRVPDEFMEWVKTTRQSLQEAFAVEMIQAEEIVAKARKLPTRKEQAKFILNGQIICNSKIAFALLDGKQEQAEEIGWKMVRPKAERPFKEDEP